MWWRILIFLVIIYYAIKLISELFVSNRISNAERRRKKAYNDYLNRKKAEEGKVTFDYDDNNKRKKRYTDEGEYVDYEEI